MIGGFFKKGAPTHFAKPYTLAHDKLFHLLEARRGRGKSYSMSTWALECALLGIGTLANFHINHYWVAMRLVSAGKFHSLDAAVAWCEANILYSCRWDDFLLAYNKLVLVDEVNRLFDSQDRSKEDRVPKVVLEWLQQSRRNDITLVFAAQSLDWLSPRVRQLFDLMWRAKKEMGTGKERSLIKRFWLYGADPWAKGLSHDVQRGTEFKVSIKFDKRTFRLYDTKERIAAIPNVASFESFGAVYAHQLQAGIVPPPAPRPDQAPKCGACFALFGGRAAPGLERPRPGAAPYGRHAVKPVASPPADPAIVPATKRALNPLSWGALLSSPGVKSKSAPGGSRLQQKRG